MKKLTFLICFALVSVFAQAQWISVSSGTTVNLNSVFFPYANIGYAVGGNTYYGDDDRWEYEGIIIKTIDGGTTWANLSSGKIPLNSVYFTDINTGYIVGGGRYSETNGIILKTINGGITWDTLINETAPLNSIYITDNNTAFVVGGTGYNLAIILSQSTMAPFDIIWYGISQGYDITPQLNSVYFTDANTGYAVGGYYSGSQALPCGSTRIILKTIDGGVSWDTLSNEYGALIKSVYFTDANTGYAVGNRCSYGNIEKTVNGGQTWETLWSTYIELYSVHFTNVNTGYAVGTVGKDISDERGIVLTTNNAGASWDTLSTNITASFNSVFFINESTGYIVGGGGIILKTTNGGGLISIKEAKTQPPTSTFTLNPNPATNKISITTTGKLQGETQISIYSINGAKISTHKFQNTQSFELDVSQLAKGIYLLQLQSNEGVETQKLVVE